MDELLQNPLVRAALGLGVLVVLGRLAAKVFGGKTKDTMHVKVKCKKCTWTGMVGKYNRRCYSCNGTELITLER